MAELFRDKYRIPSARLQSWDYSGQGMYFITICTAQRECYFGNIVGAEDTAVLHLTDMGIVAANEWLKIAVLRPDMNLELGEYVIMPNHIHGIIMIGENQYNADNIETKKSIAIEEAPHNSFGKQAKNIASIIRGYKSAVTSYAIKNNIPFAWQPRFHDHIIRSTEEYNKIAFYIINNPAQWPTDKFYK